LRSHYKSLGLRYEYEEEDDDEPHECECGGSCQECHVHQLQEKAFDLDDRIAATKTLLDNAAGLRALSKSLFTAGTSYHPQAPLPAEAGLRDQLTALRTERQEVLRELCAACPDCTECRL
jgi:hypothetical protein